MRHKAAIVALVFGGLLGAAGVATLFLPTPASDRVFLGLLAGWALSYLAAAFFMRESFKNH